MIKTIDIRGKNCNAYRHNGMTHLQAIECYIRDIITDFSNNNCCWVTNVATYGDLISISALNGINYPGESKPSQIFWQVIALNESDMDYCHLCELGFSESRIRDELLTEVETRANDYGQIKAWHIGYLPGFAIVIASI
mgnify:FL=1